jgi:tripartite-type tricarboxylate transporter receptor subunit TctC
MKTIDFKRRLLLAVGCGVATLSAAFPSVAQEFPTRPVTIVVGFAPGGSNDIMARNVQAKLAERLGVPVVVENRPGGGGVVGTSYVAKAAPDGYTLLLTWDTHVVNSLVMKDLPFDIFKDFVPVSFLGRFPLVMVTRKDLPANNLREFVALAKKQPGKMNFASVGAGSSTRLQAENLIKLAGIEVVHIPYKGAGPSVMALVTGEVAFSFLSYGAIKGQLDGGKLKALAVTGATRMPELPDVPTTAESGYPDSQGYSWIGMFAPAGTPEAVVQRLNREFKATLADAEVQRKITGIGVEPISSTPQELDAYVKTEYGKWSKFVKESKLNFAD